MPSLHTASEYWPKCYWQCWALTHLLMHLHCVSPLMNDMNWEGRQYVYSCSLYQSVSQKWFPQLLWALEMLQQIIPPMAAKALLHWKTKWFASICLKKKKNVIFTTFSCCRHIFKLSFSDLKGVITQGWLLEMLNFHLYQWKLETSKNQIYTYPV